MSSLQASRTLVKSPPELWAELSDLGSLARHLGEFGEIRITKVDPESRVEWEADRASGTVRLEPSGWGTRVVLTVDTPEPPAADPEPTTIAAAIEAAAEAEPVAEAEAPEVEAEPMAEAEAPEVEAEPAAEYGPAEAEAGPMAAAEDDPMAESDHAEAPDEPVAVAEEPAPKRGFWARLFGRKKMAPVEPAPEPEPVAAEPEPEPELEAPSEDDKPFGTIEWEVPEPPAAEEEPEPEPAVPSDPEAVLHTVLDTLGAAHHRPFSRS